MFTIESDSNTGREERRREGGGRERIEGGRGGRKVGGKRREVVKGRRKRERRGMEGDINQLWGISDGVVVVGKLIIS